VCEHPRMPTTRRPSPVEQRAAREARRLRAAELFVQGKTRAEVARELGVSRQSAHVWYDRFINGGVEALRSRGPTGPDPKLSDAELAHVEQALLKGAMANGFDTDLWRACGPTSRTWSWPTCPAPAWSRSPTRPSVASSGSAPATSWSPGFWPTPVCYWMTSRQPNPRNSIGGWCFRLGGVDIHRRRMPSTLPLYGRSGCEVRRRRSVVRQ
jgi:transposase